VIVDLDQLLRAASVLAGCSEVAIRCQCENLEVVYVEREDDRLLVTDRRETFQYLARVDDSAFDLGLLDWEEAREICRSHDTELDTGQPEMFPRIQREIALTDGQAAAAVAAVASAVDAIYQAAMRPDLR
jgi:hypothetical protein